MFQETLPANTLARFRKSTEAGKVIGDDRFCAEIKACSRAESSATDTAVTAEALSSESARTIKISEPFVSRLKHRFGRSRRIG